MITQSPTLVLDHVVLDRVALDQKALDHGVLDHGVLDHLVLDHMLLNHLLLDHTALDHWVFGQLQQSVLLYRKIRRWQGEASFVMFLWQIPSVASCPEHQPHDMLARKILRWHEWVGPIRLLTTGFLGNSSKAFCCTAKFAVDRGNPYLLCFCGKPFYGERIPKNHYMTTRTTNQWKVSPGERFAGQENSPLTGESIIWYVF